MGNGIAHVFAQNGFDVSLIDISEAALTKGLATIEKNIDRQVKKGILKELDKPFILKRITTYTRVNDGVKNADLVIEAATENKEVKNTIFMRILHFTIMPFCCQTHTYTHACSFIAREK